MEECIKISEGLPPLEGLRHLARASHKLSCIFSVLGKDKESVKQLERATNAREQILKLDGDEVLGKDAVSDFEELVPWMLW